MYEDFACMNMDTLHACLECKQARGGHLQKVVSTIYILGTDTGSSEEATRAFKCPIIYTAPRHQDFDKPIQLYMKVILSNNTQSRITLYFRALALSKMQTRSERHSPLRDITS